jgi:TonB family protein
MYQRKKRNSSKVNLTISFVVHGALVAALAFFAAREGILGKKLKQLTVTMVPKEKKPEPPKVKPPEIKPETPKPAETPKAVAAPPPVQTAAAPPPATETPAVAPAAVSLPGFEFHDGAKDVESISDPNTIYKTLVEHTLRSRWDRPEDIADEAYAAEVELTVDPSGKIKASRWVSGSGDKRWDDSVRAALAQTKVISRPPPKGFPEKFMVRFDVESLKTEPVFRLSSQ